MEDADDDFSGEQLLPRSIESTESSIFSEPIDNEEDSQRSSVESQRSSVGSEPQQQLDAIGVNTTAQRHIMISYNEMSRSRCIEIRNELKKLKFRVWMDVFDMYGCILKSMAEAVKNSSIVLLCVTQKYYDSYYCYLGM
ncbi:unnamed protein product [Didymodactylos carnosus]|uniref:TIR domain-containing protein n=1 Tax=Didymodactylos carnosus TaxID=1234261 RepID=A0A815AGK4_9BILA|nr:unnamed protein product [Didymodactylos carnosus]CAF4030149.1 unnamed protein product [Didymodactylos carnosus]